MAVEEGETHAWIRCHAFANVDNFRVCPGRHFALRNLHLVISNVLAAFDILPPVDQSGNPQPPPPAFKYSQVRSVTSRFSDGRGFDCLSRCEQTSAAIQLYCKAPVKKGPWSSERSVRSLLAVRLRVFAYSSTSMRASNAPGEDDIILNHFNDLVDFILCGPRFESASTRGRPLSANRHNPNIVTSCITGSCLCLGDGKSPIVASLLPRPTVQRIYIFTSSPSTITLQPNTNTGPPFAGLVSARLSTLFVL